MLSPRFPLVCLVLLSVNAQLSAAERQPIVIHAADLALSSLRAETPTPGKWWLKTGVAGVPGGAMLLTGKVEDADVPKDRLGEWNVIPAKLYATPYRVPAMEIDPKAKGWYRITVGMMNRPGLNELYALPPRLLARVGKEPYPEFLMPPLQTPGPMVEVDYRIADLTGQTIRIEQAPAPMAYPGRGWIGGLSHIKLTPLTEAEVAAVRTQEELAPVKNRPFGLLDTPDEIYWWGTVESEDDLRAIVYRHEKAGFGRVYFRCWGSHLDSSAAIPDANPRWTDADEKAFIAKQGTVLGWRPYLDFVKKTDLLKVTSDYAKERGIEVHAWVRFTNLNRPPYAEFWHKHPEFIAQLLSRDPKTGKDTFRPYSRVLSMAHPEVRAFYVSFFKQLASTGTPGILIDLLRHPPLAGFEKPAADAFKKKYGVEMASLIKPGTASKDTLFSDPRMGELHGDFLELFLKELREAVGPKLEIGVRSRGPDAFGLRGKAWIESGLIQTIMDGNWYSGYGPRSTIDATVAAAGTKGHAFAIAESCDFDIKTFSRKTGTLQPEGILFLARHYRAKKAGFGLYESTEFMWHPEQRRAIRQAGWIAAGEEK